MALSAASLLCNKELFAFRSNGTLVMNRPSSTSPSPPPLGFWRPVFGLCVFGLAFAYVEAAVVVYLRGLYEPIHRHFHPAVLPADLFPLLTIEQLRSYQPAAPTWLGIECGREAATLVMLAAVALAAAPNARTWLAAFALAFGVWDVAFYGWLRVFIDWPPSLMTWDVLFLLPVPWAAPVIAPVIVAITLVCAGVLTLWCESRGRPVVLSAAHWAGLILGGLIVVAAFCWDFRNTAAGGLPNPFHWPLLLTGLFTGLATLTHALIRGHRTAPRQREGQ